MQAYLLRRSLLIFPTLLGIMAINFAVIQFAPGGPIEQAIANLQQLNADPLSRITGDRSDLDAGAASGDSLGVETGASSRRHSGVDPEIIERLREQYGFDKPALYRFGVMLRDYALLDFGQSYYRDASVIELIVRALPVSISLGLWSTAIIYLVSIPLGIRKAIRAGSPFDNRSTTLLIALSSIPSFMFGLLLLIFLAGGRFFDIFPMRGLISENFAELSLFGQAIDYLWHLALPITAITISGFAGLTLLTRNAFIDQLGNLYVMAARARGAGIRRTLYFHVFRNAMLIVIAGFPATLVGVIFTSATLIEILFSLNGLGLLTYEAVIARDYPVFFAGLYMGALLGLVLNIINDLMYHVIDRRIQFDAREA